MFTRVASAPAKQVIVHFEGRDLLVTEGLSVAAALLEAGIEEFRKTPVTHASRKAYCMMGVCFDCLVVIDGQTNQQACMQIVKDGMTIARQDGAANVMEGQS